MARDKLGISRDKPTGRTGDFAPQNIANCAASLIQNRTPVNCGD
jgi:hypothetical protein